MTEPIAPGTTRWTFLEHAVILFLRALSCAAAALAVSWAWWGDQPLLEAAALLTAVAVVWLTWPQGNR